MEQSLAVHHQHRNVCATGLPVRDDPRSFIDGEQNDDDLNTESFILQPYAVWDATVNRAITRGLNAFVAVENILDTEYDTARTPLRQIGWPRTVRVGARVSWQ